MFLTTASLVCFYPAVAEALLLLLSVIVCGGIAILPRFNAPDQQDFFLMFPLVQYCQIHTLDLPLFLYGSVIYNASSKIAGMREAKVASSPPRRSALRETYCFLHHSTTEKLHHNSLRHIWHAHARRPVTDFFVSPCH